MAYFLQNQVLLASYSRVSYFINVCSNGKLYKASDCNRIRTHNHLIRKRTLNHLAKLAK